MNLFKALFSSNQAIDTLSSGVDKAFYTKEEKADDFLNLLKAYEPFKLAQRLLALIVSIPYVTVWILAAILFISSVFFDPCLVEVTCKASQLLETSKALAEWNNKVLGEAVVWVLIFYFGGGAVEGVAGKVMERRKTGT